MSTDRSAPTLEFEIMGASAIAYAALPTIGFALRVTSANSVPIQAISLSVQIRIAPASRSYDTESKARLMELFGTPDRWGTTLNTFLWTHAPLQVPAFSDAIEVTIPVACTYDFDVAVTKYLDGVRDGEIALAFLFSGTVFYRDSDERLQTCRISWESDAAFAFPVQVWHDAMNLYFPDTAWLRVGREQFDRLYAYRCARGLLTWESTVDALLETAAVSEEG